MENENQQARPQLASEPRVEPEVVHQPQPAYDPEEGRRLWEAQQALKQTQQVEVEHVGHNGRELQADSGRGAGELPGASGTESAPVDVVSRTEHHNLGDGRTEHRHVESNAGNGQAHLETKGPATAGLGNDTDRVADAPIPDVRVEPKAPEQTAPAAPPVSQQAPAQPAEPAPAQHVESVAQPQGTILDDADSSTLEFAALEERDPVNLYSDNTLGGWMTQLSDVDRNIAKFMRTLQRDEEGKVLFRNDTEEDIFHQIKRFRGLVSPQYSTGVQVQTETQQRPGVTWANSLDVGEGVKIAIQRHPNATKGVLGAIYRRNNSGAPVTMWLPATGIYIESEAPHESDICDYDMMQTMETSKVGMSSYGLLLSASSGLYIKHMFNFALRFVTSATVETGENDMHQTLAVIIDERDYWLVVVNCLIAKFPGGIPWQLACSDHTCNHEETTKLNLARSIRYGNGILTPVQQEMARRQRNGAMMTLQEISEYQKGHVDTPESTFKDEDLTVKFRHVPVAEFIDTAEEWVADINRAATEALGQYPTENERDKHIRVNAEARRLLRYAHMVESISAFDENNKPVVERDTIKIREALTNLSSDRRYVLAFEEAIERFNESTRLAVFGYMSRACPTCGHVGGEEGGTYRGIVPISPDRLFFVLSRVVYEIQKLLADQFADIG